MRTRCIICQYEEDEEKIPPDATCCPECGTRYTPCSSKYDVMPTINWQELRTMIIWAERWAAQHNESDPEMTNCIRAIANRIQSQFPDLAEESPLTFYGEIKQLRKAFGDVEQNVVPD